MIFNGTKYKANNSQSLLNKKFIITVAFASSLGLSGCSSTTQVGATGVQRKQLLLVSSQEVISMANQQYATTLTEARKQGVLDTDPEMLSRLQRISQRIIQQVGVFRPAAKLWSWEVHTLKSKQLNAYVSPGGKIMFYTGIIDRLQLTDDEIAAIMGHEVSHALREHARERLSRHMASQMGFGLIAQVAGLNADQMRMAGMVNQLAVGLPHSRAQESEADVLGVELAARAGYNPKAAISLWKKMQAASRGGSLPFLSTHPSSTNRINHLNSLMSTVMPLYAQSQYAQPQFSQSNQYTKQYQPKTHRFKKGNKYTFGKYQ